MVAPSFWDLYRVTQTVRENGVISGARAQTGGCLTQQGATRGFYNSVTFEKCVATNGGGAVVFQRERAYSKFTNVTMRCDGGNVSQRCAGGDVWWAPDPSWSGYQWDLVNASLGFTNPAECYVYLNATKNRTCLTPPLIDNTTSVFTNTSVPINVTTSVPPNETFVPLTPEEWADIETAFAVTSVVAALTSLQSSNPMVAMQMMAVLTTVPCLSAQRSSDDNWILSPLQAIVGPFSFTNRFASLALWNIILLATVCTLHLGVWWKMAVPFPGHSHRVCLFLLPGTVFGASRQYAESTSFDIFHIVSAFGVTAHIAPLLYSSFLPKERPFTHYSQNTTNLLRRWLLPVGMWPPCDSVGKHGFTFVSFLDQREKFFVLRVVVVCITSVLSGVARNNCASVSTLISVVFGIMSLATLFAFPYVTRALSVTQILTWGLQCAFVVATLVGRGSSDGIACCIVGVSYVDAAVAVGNMVWSKLYGMAVPDGADGGGSSNEMAEMESNFIPPVTAADKKCERFYASKRATVGALDMDGFEPPALDVTASTLPVQKDTVAATVGIVSTKTRPRGQTSPVPKTKKTPTAFDPDDL